ncbi:MAG: hypothetical protein IIA01_00200 [Proteobacteria bacterium]|nr:hypothetical protein [Pseudomonadota bacterium]
MKRARKYDPDEFETWDMEVMFAGKGHAGGSPWIAVECLAAPQLPNLYGGILGLDFYPGTSVCEAEALIELMNKYVSHITFTATRQPEFAGTPGRGERARRARGNVTRLSDHRWRRTPHKESH